MTGPLDARMRRAMQRLDELERQASRMFLRRPAGGGPATPAASTVSIEVSQSAHGYAVGQVVRFSGVTGQWELTSAAAYSTAQAAGIISVADTDTFTVVLAGLIDIPGLAIGIHYVSATTPGSRTQTPPDLELPCLVGIGSDQGIVIPRIATGSFGDLDVHGKLTVRATSSSDVIEHIEGSNTYTQYIDSDGDWVIEHDSGGATTELFRYDTATQTLQFQTSFTAPVNTLRTSGIEFYSDPSADPLPATPNAEIRLISTTDTGIEIYVNGSLHETIAENSGGSLKWGVFGSSALKQDVTDLTALTTVGTADSSYGITERNMLNSLKADANAIHTTLDELATALSNYGAINLV